nr:unnamed protein product [Digitaria exilis]
MATSCGEGDRQGGHDNGLLWGRRVGENEEAMVTRWQGMPENLIYNTNYIVRLWVSEGFLKPKKGKTMEDIGQSYLKELISRGMINLVRKDPSGGVWLVTIHDRVHAFAQSEAYEESFLEVHDNADLLMPNSRTGNSVKNRDHNGLRYHGLQFIPRSKFLRVIDLRGMRIKKVPREIGDMVHIRYLGIRSHSLVDLPSSIGRLINLQTLDIESSHVKISGLTTGHWEALADAFKKLESLLHLHLAAAESADDKIPFQLLTKFTLQRVQVLELYGAIDMSNTDIDERYVLPNLNRLVLKGSVVNQTFMNRIGELPSLKELVLCENSYTESKLMFSDSGFNSVTNLVMADMENLVEWTIRPMSIPMIRRIALSGFSNLKIKLEGHKGAECPKDLMVNLEEVVVCNMTGDILIEPADSGFSEKINKVAIRTKSEDIMDATLRAGRWRESMVAGNMF